MKTAEEFWIERFGKRPKTKQEKLAVVMMTEYAEYCNRFSQPYRCPVCYGSGSVPAGFYGVPITNGYWSSTDSVRETCRSCQGKGIVNF